MAPRSRDGPTLEIEREDRAEKRRDEVVNFAGDHFRPDRNAFVEVDHLLVDQPEATR